MKIKSLFTWIGVIAIALVIVIVLNPFSMFFTGGTKQSHHARTTGPATVRVVPEYVDCRAYVDASVPGKNEAKSKIEAHGRVPLLDWHLDVEQDYNTDTVWMTAKGDVETCFPDTGASVTQNGPIWEVHIDRSQTIFNRPRVRPAATAKSVHYEPGATQQVVSFIPFLNKVLTHNNGPQLTLEGEQFAQSIIGGSRCMKAAWPATERAIIAAYQKQAMKKGIALRNVKVTFTGTPLFDQNDMKRIPKAFASTNFTVDSKHVECKLIN